MLIKLVVEVQLNNDAIQTLWLLLSHLSFIWWVAPLNIEGARSHAPQGPSPGCHPKASFKLVDDLGERSFTLQSHEEASLFRSFFFPHQIFIKHCNYYSKHTYMKNRPQKWCWMRCLWGCSEGVQFSLDSPTLNAQLKSNFHISIHSFVWSSINLSFLIIK